MSTKNVSLKAIAAQMNVSINTVSHAIRDMDDVSEALKLKIRKKAIEMGYMPNHVAQHLKRDEKPVVAILVDSFTNLYFNTFSNELTKLLYERKEFDFMILYAGQLKCEVIKQCVLLRVDLVVTHLEPDAETLEFAKLNNIQMVFVGSSHFFNDVDTVAIDNQMGCSLAAHYLLNFHECKKFLYAGVNYFLSEERFNIFRSELQSLSDDCDVRYFNSDEEDVRALYTCISQGYRNVFFYNDRLAYELLGKLDSIAINIRRIYPDLHLVGFDGLCECVAGLKQISTIKIDFPEFAEKTYEVIKKRLEQPSAPMQQIVLKVTLHQRRKD